MKRINTDISIACEYLVYTEQIWVLTFLTGSLLFPFNIATITVHLNIIQLVLILAFIRTYKLYFKFFAKVKKLVPYFLATEIIIFIIYSITVLSKLSLNTNNKLSKSRLFFFRRILIYILYRHQVTGQTNRARGGKQHAYS